MLSNPYGQFKKQTEFRGSFSLKTRIMSYFRYNLAFGQVKNLGKTCIN